ncbi:MAG: NADP-dependent oxidoreductase [Dehalococcoidia bacterium]
MNRQWRLAFRPAGRVGESNFEWYEEPVPEVAEGEVLVRNIYLSVDPTYRVWMGEEETYMPPVGIGEVMRGVTVGVVEESRNDNFQPGDMVQGMLGWQDYTVDDGSNLVKLITDSSIPLTYYLGIFGGNGLAAYFGLFDVGKPESGETLVVSAAAGAVGSLVGQIGRIMGCRVIGIAGSNEKCRWITDELGFDAAINYKVESVEEGLQTHCPDGIDIYFDNVGGEMLDMVLGRINLHARIVICGMISQYNSTDQKLMLSNFPQVLYKRARIQGFIVFDHLERVIEAMTDLGTWLFEGKLKYRVQAVDGLENAPAAVNMLFDGSNTGKLIVKISEESEL